MRCPYCCLSKSISPFFQKSFWRSYLSDSPAGVGIPSLMLQLKAASWPSFDLHFPVEERRGFTSRNVDWASFFRPLHFLLWGFQQCKIVHLSAHRVAVTSWCAIPDTREDSQAFVSAFSHWLSRLGGLSQLVGLCWSVAVTARRLLFVEIHSLFVAVQLFRCCSFLKIDPTYSLLSVLFANCTPLVFTQLSRSLFLFLSSVLRFSRSVVR